MTTSAAPVYVLENAWEHALHRLRLLEQCFDEGTRRRLGRLGVAPGWSCLELGAGAGSITRWLCGQVGAEGRVLAVDLDTRFLEDIEASNLEVRCADVVLEPPPLGAFDLVHCRAVLMHLPERAEILSHLVAALRPGGWLLVEEGDFYPVTARTTGAYHAAWAAVNKAMGRVGLAAGWAHQLPDLLQREGLAGVAAEADVEMFPGGSACAELVGMTWEQALGRLPVPDAARRQVALAQAELNDPQRWFVMPALVAAWGRRP
jgi:2-polyprenyl-3-methyl-5-hydroxy-6-metoxy-1,4-benzoquinol methylase